MILGISGVTEPRFKTTRLKFVTSFPKQSEVRGIDPGTPVSFIPMTAVSNDGLVDTTETKLMSEASSGYTYFADYDVVIAKITPCFENGKGAIARGLVNGIGFGTTELFVVRPSPLVDVRFLYYFTVSQYFRGVGTGLMYGAGGQKRIPESLVLDIPFPEIEKYRQAQIADFLDRETAKADALVARYQRLIELLEEKRIALITQAVTKGLDPTVPMKDSGVEWIGEIPRNWQINRLRFLCQVQTGDGDTIDAVDDGAFPFFVRSQNVEQSDRYSFDCEAVLTAGDGAGVGKVFHYFVGKFTAHQRVYVLSAFRNALGRFVFYYLRDLFSRVALEGTAKSTVDSLRMPIFLNFPVAVPSLSEQAKIVHFIETESSQIQMIIDKCQRAVHLMKERRSGLITAAVTGQIDIPSKETALETVP